MVKTVRSAGWISRSERPPVQRRVAGTTKKKTAGRGLQRRDQSETGRGQNRHSRPARRAESTDQKLAVRARRRGQDG